MRLMAAYEGLKSHEILATLFDACTAIRLCTSRLSGSRDCSHSSPVCPKLMHCRCCIWIPEMSLNSPSAIQRSFYTIQNMAKIFGGLATPPGTLTTSLVTKKLHLFSFAQCSPSFSRSKSSPIGQPQPARRTSCIDQPSDGGKG
jgi:hypothetical protein